MVGFIGISVLLREILMNGFIGIWNQTADVLGQNTDIFLKKYQIISEKSMEGDKLVFLAFAVIVASVAVYGMLRGGWSFLLLVSGFVLQAGAVFLGKNLSGTPCVLYYTGIILAEKYILSGGKKKASTGNRYEILLWECVLFILLAGAGAVVWKTAVPAVKYKEPSVVSEIREKTVSAAEKLRFQKEEINTLPKGELAKAGAWKASGDTALKVTMEKPESLYLRGFVGSDYQGDFWKSQKPSVYYEKKDMFYWLHRNEFYGNRQLASVREMVKEDSLSDERSKVYVENVGADSQYLYIPYEMTETPAGFEETRNSGDGFLKSGNFFGTRSYEFETMGNLVKDFPRLAALSYLAGKEEQNQQYRENESYYNAFVYEYDTELSDEMRSLFQKELGTAGDQKKSHMDYYSAITHIRSYLEKNMIYGNQTEPLPKGKDFVKNFLTETKIGHSVHFASTAALMFRYYGIPSRYVEGYLITPEDVKNVEAGEELEIAGKNGHAWTEIYVDGLGWVPLEMTPEYYGIMEEPDLTVGLEADGTKAAKPPKPQEEKEWQEEEGNLQRVLSLALYQIGKIILMALILFDILCLLFFLWVLLKRTTANIRRRRAFKVRDNGQAARQMIKYAEKLYQHKEGDFSENVENLYQKAYRIGEKAAFSQHGISVEERKTAENCVRLLLKELKKMRGWYDRWVMRYIERLY